MNSKSPNVNNPSEEEDDDDASSDDRRFLLWRLKNLLLLPRVEEVDGGIFA
jgi:hypothetical protein